MGWESLVRNGELTDVFPWLGGRRIHGKERSWRVVGDLPHEFGWYRFELAAGRSAKLLEPCDPDPLYAEGRTTVRGYVIGDRFIPEKARVDPDPTKLVEQTVPIYLVEQGLDRFQHILAAADEENRWIYVQQLYSLQADEKAKWAFVERKESLDNIKDVTPALDLAFRFAFLQRQILEERRAEREKQRLEREKLENARKSAATGLGRRTLASTDFEAAAKAALAVGGAEFLDCRQGHYPHEMVVQYRFENRRLECVVERATFQVIDSGICLTDHQTGEKGDNLFTLESLPAVVRQAIKEHKLVVYRHADGVDWRNEPDDNWEDD